MASGVSGSDGGGDGGGGSGGGSGGGGGGGGDSKCFWLKKEKKPWKLGPFGPNLVSCKCMAGQGVALQTWKRVVSSGGPSAYVFKTST